MKVEVVDPDEEKTPERDAAADQRPCEGETACAEQGQAAAPAGEAADASAATGGEGVLDAEFETIDPRGDKKGKKKAKAEEEVFSLADLETARADAAAANDRYLRLEAEWDNYRKRTARERESERARAAEGLVTKLLPVVDDVERAIDHADKSNPQGEFAQFVDGVRAMHAKLVDVLAREGVEAINPVDQPFNMHEHQAVAHVEDAEAYEETVRDVYQKGYRMGDRIIRPAMVTVTTGGPSRPIEAAGASKGTQDGSDSAEHTA